MQSREHSLGCGCPAALWDLTATRSLTVVLPPVSVPRAVAGGTSEPRGPSAPPPFKLLPSSCPSTDAGPGAHHVCRCQAPTACGCASACRPFLTQVR